MVWKTWRTWAVSGYLCLTTLAPMVISIFFPNSAYKPISHFLHNISEWPSHWGARNPGCDAIGLED